MAELHTQKNLDDYLTGSVVYLHKEVTNIRNSPQNKGIMYLIFQLLQVEYRYIFKGSFSNLYLLKLLYNTHSFAKILCVFNYLGGIYICPLPLMLKNNDLFTVCCTIVTEDAICVSTPITIHPSDEHEMMYLPDKDTSALLSNRSNSPQTPISTIGRHFKRTVNGVPSAWQESTPLVAPDCKSQDLERETVL